MVGLGRVQIEFHLSSNAEYAICKATSDVVASLDASLPCRWCQDRNVGGNVEENNEIV